MTIQCINKAQTLVYFHILYMKNIIKSLWKLVNGFSQFILTFITE